MTLHSAIRRGPPTEPLWVQRLLIAAAVLVLTVLIIVPVINIFAYALQDGVGAYWKHLTGDADTWHAIKLTLFVAPIAVVLNVLFGIAAAWLLTRFSFPGRTLLTSLIDLPFAVSPVVAGL
ncbi:MAG: sulfate/thiosulfate ABC transporter permease CysW, partial [Planctomycetaceae bacterium]|nr:sulfate/thiosulfate ABC transporter permease CysW [Planctomycetaceae bacterium]